MCIVCSAKPSLTCSCVSCALERCGSLMTRSGQAPGVGAEKATLSLNTTKAQEDAGIYLEAKWHQLLTRT